MFLIVVFARFLGVIGHHEDEFPIERLDVNTTGEMDYNKQKKLGILPKTGVGLSKLSNTG